jgi:transcription initiation factor TFIID TATA-box-binding protein
LNPHINIVNVVASTKIKGNFDIEFISDELENTEYDPERFSGLIYRHRCTFIIFYSGKATCTGTKTEQNAYHELKNLLTKLHEIGGIIGSRDHDPITIENVVGSGLLGYKLDLHKLHDKIPNSKYDPKIFTGMRFRPYNNSTVCLLFNNGKIVIVGGKNENAIRHTFNYALTLVKEKLELKS